MCTDAHFKHATNFVDKLNWTNGVAKLSLHTQHKFCHSDLYCCVCGSMLSHLRVLKVLSGNQVTSGLVLYQTLQDWIMISSSSSSSVSKRKTLIMSKQTKLLRHDKSHKCVSEHFISWYLTLYYREWIQHNTLQFFIIYKNIYLSREKKIFLDKSLNHNMNHKIKYFNFENILGEHPQHLYSMQKTNKQIKTHKYK